MSALRATRVIFVLMYLTPIFLLPAIIPFKNIMLSIALLCYLPMPFAWWYGKMLSPEPLLVAFSSISVYVYLYHRRFIAFSLVLGLTILQAGIKLNTLPFLWLPLFAFQQRWITLKHLIIVVFIMLFSFFLSNPPLFLSESNWEIYQEILQKYTGRWQISFVFQNLITWVLIKLWRLEGFAFDGVLSTYGLFYFSFPLPILIGLFLEKQHKGIDFKTLGLILVGITYTILIFWSAYYYPWYWTPLAAMLWLVFFYHLRSYSLSTLPIYWKCCLAGLIPFSLLHLPEINYQWFMSKSQAEAIRYRNEDKSFLEEYLQNISPDDACVLNYTLPYIGTYPLHYQRINWSILAIINYHISDSVALAPCSEVYFVGHQYLLKHHVAHSKYKHYQQNPEKFVIGEFERLYPSFKLADVQKNERIAIFKFARYSAEEPKFNSYE